MKRGMLALGVGLVTAALAGCGGSASAQVDPIDLNKVLDVLARVLEEPAEGGAADVAVENEGEAAVAEVQAIDPANEDAVKRDAFLKRFAEELNKEPISTATVGVAMQADGSIEGFTDPNSNMQKDAGEQQLFTVQIDAERNRLIASDGEHHRDHSYRPRFGFFSGYMLGSMLGRQNGFYSGSSKPDFSRTQMSSPNYHSDAVAKARARAPSGGSVRSRSGSGGFSFGK